MWLARVFILFSLPCIASPAGPFAFSTAALVSAVQLDGKTKFTCPNGYFPYGNMGTGGPALLEAAGLGYICDPANSRWITNQRADSGTDTVLTTVICRPIPDSDADEIACIFTMNGLIYGADAGQIVKCPAGGNMKLLNPTPQDIESMRCDPESKMYATLPAGNEILVLDTEVSIECVPPTTTTSTTTTTTSAPTTTTTPKKCPPGGVWSEWITTGSCPGTCGACHNATRTRTCSKKCGDCPCTGLATDSGPCKINMCPFPSPVCKTCCPPYIKSLNYETSTFFCGPRNVEKTICP